MLGVTGAPAAATPNFGFNDNSVRSGTLSASESAQLDQGAGAGIVRLTFDWRYAVRIRSS